MRETAAQMDTRMESGDSGETPLSPFSLENA